MRTLRTPSQLCDHGLSPPKQRAALEAVAARYAVALPPALADLIDPNDPHDPIARQFVPDAAELDVQPQELSDPIGDDVHSPVEGIVHRYPDRVLLKLTPICAVYCRFCFRRETVGPGKANALSAAALTHAFDYIRRHRQIWEVILTGGDPLVLSARRLRAVMKELAAIDHVKVLRIHTRVPVAEPARLTVELVRAIKVKGKPTYVALHIKPYYLHHGDLAPGTAHLRTDIATGQNLMRALRGRLSGLCQPTYVLDIPGGHGKSPIGPDYFARTGSNGAAHFVVEDFNGRRHRYPPAPGASGA